MCCLRHSEVLDAQALLREDDPVRLRQGWEACSRCNEDGLRPFAVTSRGPGGLIKCTKLWGPPLSPRVPALCWERMALLPKMQGSRRDGVSLVGEAVGPLAGCRPDGLTRQIDVSASAPTGRKVVRSPRHRPADLGVAEHVGESTPTMDRWDRCLTRTRRATARGRRLGKLRLA